MLRRSCAVASAVIWATRPVSPACSSMRSTSRLLIPLWNPKRKSRGDVVDTLGAHFGPNSSPYAALYRPPLPSIWLISHWNSSMTTARFVGSPTTDAVVSAQVFHLAARPRSRPRWVMTRHRLARAVARNRSIFQSSFVMMMSSWPVFSSSRLTPCAVAAAPSSTSPNVRLAFSSSSLALSAASAASCSVAPDPCAASRSSFLTRSSRDCRSMLPSSFVFIRRFLSGDGRFYGARTGWSVQLPAVAGISSLPDFRLDGHYVRVTRKHPPLVQESVGVRLYPPAQGAGLNPAR